MRYIGSKANLLPEIHSAVTKHAPNAHSFCDLFAGTGVVGQSFKTSHTVMSNDILYFSFVINSALVGLSGQPQFSCLRKELGTDPIDFLNGLTVDLSKVTDADLTVTEFSPVGHSQRAYLTGENAYRVDKIRQLIDEWRDGDLISAQEHLYLLAALLMEIPSVSNIAGTYGAFLKHWDKRAHKPLAVRHLKILVSKGHNQVFNENANELVRKISGDVIYIDTPYNSRQYSSNYHVLETIARYDFAELKGVTGTRADSSGRSDYCQVAKVEVAFNDLFTHCNFGHVVVSYSSDGLVSRERLEDIITEAFKPRSLETREIPYRRYRRLSGDDRDLLEYLIVATR